MKLEYIIKDEKTINQILKEEFEISNRLFSKLINNNKVFLNEKVVDTRLLGNIGDKLTIDLDMEEDSLNIVAKKMNLDIVYEDEGMIVLNKPAGIPVHPSMSHYEDSLANGVKYYFESNGIHKKIRPVNRLDLDTSGLIIFAKNEYIQENLIRQMKNGIFKKEYLAIIEGTLENKKGIIDSPIARKEKSIIERCVSQDGQKAITEYEVLNENKEYSLIKCTLHTGRTHQIRVHMAYIGHPILGDTLYGTNSKLINRQALHSYKISFIHPVTKEKMNFECEPEFFKLFSENIDIKIERKT